jgi:hypothetical protein
VEDAEQGKANSRCGHYYYKFDPDVVHVDESSTLIEYKLAEKDEKRFEVVQLYVTDANAQIAEPKRSHDNTVISIVHKNTTRQLTVVTVRVRDRKHSRHVNCDPQVTNDPPPVLGGGT